MSTQAPRKHISKSVRFDIFHRDGFTCQYCGLKPPAVVLELDHILPVARGGSSEEMNLITSCSVCNSGKSDKILGEVRPTPDADLQYLKVEQQRMEYERYLAASAAREAVTSRVINRIQAIWSTCFNMDDVPDLSIIKGWLGRHNPDIIERAIENSIPAFQKGIIRNFSSWQFLGMVKYVSVVMRNLDQKEDS